MISTICHKAKLLLKPFVSNVKSLAATQVTYSTNTGSTQPQYDEAEQRAFLSSLPGGKIDLEKDNTTGIATVTLNRPEIHNAFGGSMMVELRDVVDELAKWDEGKGVVVRGTAGTFCSGGDLKFMNSISSFDAGHNMSRYMGTTLHRLLDLPLISVALLEGVTLGGGAELAMACDFRLAAPAAKIGFVQVHMGIVPGWGGGARLVHKIGRTNALDILCTGKIMKAEEAIECGLIEHILADSENTIEAARNWLKKRTFQDAEVTRNIKSVVLNAADGVTSLQIKNEEITFAKLWSGPAHTNAVNKKIKHV